MRAVEVGFDVVGFDVDERKIGSLRKGASFVGDVDSAVLQASLDSGRYLPTTRSEHLSDFDVAVVTVPTPLRDGAPDLSFIESAAKSLASFVRSGSLVILESTTFPGTTEEILAPILEKGSGLTAGVDFHLGYSPERIDPGNMEWSFVTTPKVVSGIDGASLAMVEDFYGRLVDKTISVRGTREAEMCKLLENTFRHINIALVNEMAIHANGLGIDIWEVVEAAATKPFGFMRFNPGPGVGGHCLPIDPSYLLWRVERELGVTSRIVRAANEVNSQMPRYVAQRLLLSMNNRSRSLAGARVLVVGISYKKNSNDVRESPSIELIHHLNRFGSTVLVHDPYVEGQDLGLPVEHVALDPEVLHTSDIVVIMTDHDNVDYAMIADHAPFVFDTRNRATGNSVEYL
jgi:nucleotide sugar dehydrogenase